MQTKENLLKKHSVDSDVCELCCAHTESSAYLIAGCPFSIGFWSPIGVPISEDDVSRLWGVRAPPGVPALHFNMFLLLCCWRLWKHRHDVVFRSLPPCYNRLFAGCREDVELWSCRLPRADRHVALIWASMFPFQPPAVNISNDM
ncbi:hypothetical protein QOZ80_1AG0044170 [Eleusine coracana subsp. coracana]|nr:hypothetical protein QOZ80_1AG0044170 [Eleusine coracana subsp. coracana]